MLLVRIMTTICIGSLLFTIVMLMNVTYGLMTGVGTIDRLKKKVNNSMYLADEEPILLKDVFGVGGWYIWCLPIDPFFEDYDRVMGYRVTQLLLREKSINIINIDYNYFELNTTRYIIY